MNALEMAHYIACTLYTDEFCAVCGCAIKIEAAKTNVWTEFNGNRSLRTAHAECSPSTEMLPENPSSLNSLH